MKFLVFDTETTGIPKHPNAKDAIQPRMIEFAGVIVDEKGKWLDEYVQLFDPKVKLESVITKITGLTDHDLRGEPSFADCIGPLENLFRDADALVAHNLPFDSTMMELELKRCGYLDAWPWPKVNICTVQEHFEEYGKRPRLIELYEDTFGKPLDQTHRALDDVEALVDVCVERGVFDAAASAYQK